MQNNIEKRSPFQEKVPCDKRKNTIHLQKQADEITYELKDRFNPLYKKAFPAHIKEKNMGKIYDEASSNQKEISVCQSKKSIENDLNERIEELRNERDKYKRALDKAKNEIYSLNEEVDSLSGKYMETLEKNIRLSLLLRQLGSNNN